MRTTAVMLGLVATLTGCSGAPCRPTTKPSMREDAMHASEAPGTTQVERWKGGRQAAFTMFFDDSMDSQLANAIPALHNRGLKGTFYICPQVRWYRADVWEHDAAALEMEYANHTMTHSGVRSLAEAEAEIGGATEYILRVNPPSRTSPLMSYCTPGGLKAEAWTLTAEQMEAFKARYHLVSRPLSAGHIAARDVKTADEMFALVDKALASGGVKHIVFHGVGGDWISVSLAEFEGLLDRLEAVKDRVWVAGHIETHKYATERDTAQVTALEADERRIRLELTCQADATLYDEPLTLTTVVPASWTGCEVRQGDTVTTATPAEGRLRYQAIPNCGEIIIEPTD